MPNKFRPGHAIREPAEALNLIMAGRWIYWHGRPKHPGFMLSLQVKTLVDCAKAGRFRLAVDNTEPANV